MLLGEHPIALFAYLAHPLGIGGAEVDVLRLPPGQEGQRVGSFQQTVQRQAAQLLQKVQLTVQRLLKDGRHLAHRCLPDADRFGFEDGGGEIFAEVGGVLEEGGFKGCYSTAYCPCAPGVCRHPVGEVYELCNDVIVQQCAEDDQPVETGVPFVKIHNLVPLYSLLGKPLRHSCGLRTGLSSYNLSGASRQLPL